jgi:general secretion pathway protein C
MQIALSDIKIWLFRPIVYKMVCIGFILLVVMQIITDFTHYFEFERRVMSHRVPQSEGETKLNQQEDNVALSMPFFGDYVPKNINESDVKRSMLNLTIVGILLAAQEEESKVMIRTANGRDQTFKVGDMLPGGVTIKRITADGVLVNRNGELESLTLPKNELIFEAPAKPLSELPSS